MRQVWIAALATLAIAGAAVADAPKASDKPNYSGEWKMNPSSSSFGQFPPPSSFVRKIEHKEPALNIIEDQAAGGAQSTTLRKLTTDGQPATQQLNGYAATCSAVWDGNDIVATTNMEGVGLKFTDRMSLSADGKTLTSKVQISSNQGEGELTIVFDRQ